MACVRKALSGSLLTGLFALQPGQRSGLRRLCRLAERSFFCVNGPVLAGDGRDAGRGGDAPAEDSCAPGGACAREEACDLLAGDARQAVYGEGDAAVDRARDGEGRPGAAFLDGRGGAGAQPELLPQGA